MAKEIASYAGPTKRYLIPLIPNVRPLKPGDCIKQFDGSYHFIQYVNSSGAYAVPLSSITRDIKGHSIHFTSGGRTISANSIVEVVNPLQMGGNSPEYARYVRMFRALREGGDMARKQKPGQPVTFDEFDTSDATEGQSVSGESGTPNNEGETDMAKKAKVAKKTNGAAKREKAPKKVRNCVCGCGTETTGYFAPGHDARYHGWIKKLASGKMKPSEIGASLRAKMGLQQKGDGFVAKTPEFYKEA